MTRLCTICARGGSKGVKNKNVRMLMGKPLIAHSIEQALASELFDALAISSDSDEILEVARSWGCDYLIKRPDELASDQAAKLPVIRHCVAEVEKLAACSYETLVDLDATSPLRVVDDICSAVRLLDESGADNILTAMPARRSPYFNMVELDQSGVPHLSKPLHMAITRRQDVPACYDMNASIYVWRRNILFESNSLFNAGTRLYVMPEERSIDIDTEMDFYFVELLMSKFKSSNFGDLNG